MVGHLRGICRQCNKFVIRVKFVIRAVSQHELLLLGERLKSESHVWVCI